MVKVSELVQSNLIPNLWWETSYSSGISAAQQTQRARRARGQYGSCNLPYSKVDVVYLCVCVCVGVYTYAYTYIAFSLNFGARNMCLHILAEIRIVFSFFVQTCVGTQVCLCVCLCKCRPVELADAREMSCSVCVWLTLWSPPLIAGSMGCRHMPIFIGSWIKPLRYHL